MRSLTTAPRVTTPWRSSMPSATACARRVGSVSMAGSRNQRPAVSGGPVRVGIAGRPGRVLVRVRGGGRRDRWAGRPRPVPTSARSGASVSLPTRPDQARSHSAAVSARSSVEPTASESWRKKYAPPPASASTIEKCTGDRSSSCGSGSVSGAASARCSDTQPSEPGSPPWPAQSTSPVAVSSSSIEGA